MQKLLIFTDLDFRTYGETILGIDPEVRFKERLAHALGHYPDATHLILMGDLTNSGKAVAYGTLKAALSGLPVPFTLMCGSHDNRLNLLKTFPEMQAIPSGHLQQYLDLEDARWITLDTLDGPPFRNDYHAGYLCTDRLGGSMMLWPAPLAGSLSECTTQPGPRGFLAWMKSNCAILMRFSKCWTDTIMPPISYRPSAPHDFWQSAWP